MTDDAAQTPPQEEGFEYEGTFYRWRCSDMGKDLMLIDHFTHMPIQEFFDVVDDALERGRAPILLALIATSMRAQHPDRSVERIIRTVQDIPLGEVEFIGGDEDAGVALDMQLPDDEGGQNPPADTTAGTTNGRSSDVSSLPATDPPNLRETLVSE